MSRASRLMAWLAASLAAMILSGCLATRDASSGTRRSGFGTPKLIGEDERSYYFVADRVEYRASRFIPSISVKRWREEFRFDKRNLILDPDFHHAPVDPAGKTYDSPTSIPVSLYEHMGKWHCAPVTAAPTGP